MFSTCGQFEIRKKIKKCSVVFSFKLITDSSIRSVYYNICMLIFESSMCRILFNWECKGNLHETGSRY